MTETPVLEVEELVPVSNLIEASHFDGAVIEEEGLIKNVKILGYKSANGREYTPEAIAESAHLYEGRPVYVNHRTGVNNKMGDAYDRFGTICDPRPAPDGLRGNLRYLPSHRLSECVKDDLRLGLKCFGLSHEADGEHVKNNPRKIARITRVMRVDLVSEPATTTSLLEQTTMPEKTIQEQIDAAVGPIKETLTNEIANLREQLKLATKYQVPQTRDSGSEPVLPSGSIPFNDPKAFKDFMRTAK